MHKTNYYSMLFIGVFLFAYCTMLYTCESCAEEQVALTLSNAPTTAPESTSTQYALDGFFSDSPPYVDHLRAAIDFEERSAIVPPSIQFFLQSPATMHKETIDVAIQKLAHDIDTYFQYNGSLRIQESALGRADIVTQTSTATGHQHEQQRRLSVTYIDTIICGRRSTIICNLLHFLYEADVQFLSTHTTATNAYIEALENLKITTLLCCVHINRFQKETDTPLDGTTFVEHLFAALLFAHNFTHDKEEPLHKSIAVFFPLFASNDDVLQHIDIAAFKAVVKNFLYYQYMQNIQNIIQKKSATHEYDHILLKQAIKESPLKNLPQQSRNFIIIALLNAFSMKKRVCLAHHAIVHTIITMKSEEEMDRLSMNLPRELAAVADFFNQA
jgi:hypothetical protein